ncbi:MAG: DUF1533 domain-containing protein [Desulfotomaculaceae bacterium]|nr:DUF1533 domain-containing protein [Desulfotomaculaceae bacterium]
MRIRSKWVFNTLMTFFSVLLLVGSVTLLAPTAALAIGDDLIISGPGLNSTDPVTITQDQLRGNQTLLDGTTLQQQDVIYSTINTWPTKSWYRGQGVKLTDLLEAAGGIKPEATQIKFTSRDGFSATFTVDEILKAPRYRFPNFMSTGLPGHLPGDPSGKELVDTIIAYRSFYAQSYDDILDVENFNRSDANHLLYGQRAVTQQTNARFAKYVKQIEVLTDPAAKWDNPTITPAPGVVPAGTMVEMHSPFDDEDKVHYTLDDSVPTIESPMYNWIAKRWWSSRSEELDEINHKIGPINSDTIIKAVVIGPGRLDSDIVTFSYQVPDPPALTADVSDNIVGQPVELTFTDDADWRAAITSVSVDGADLVDGEYTISDGKITISADVFTEAKDYTVVVKATGYEDACVMQTIRSGLHAPPSLTVDALDNVVGQPVELTYTDDAAWRAAITGVSVDGTDLIDGEYTISDGKITIAADVFTEAKDYTVVVKATGYDDVSVTQTIRSGLHTPPSLTVDALDNVVGQPVEFTFSDDAAWRAAITGVSVDGTDLVDGKYTISDGKITIAADVFTEAKDYTVVVKATGYDEACVTQTIKDKTGNGGGPVDPDEKVILTITGDGVQTEKTYTLTQLQAMKQYQLDYTAINTWPSKKWYVGKGVSLRELLNEAGMKSSARLITFTARDGFKRTLTVQELLNDSRYRFPNFMGGGSHDGDGHVPGSSAGKEKVEPILGLESAEGTRDPSYMNSLNAILLMLGQRAVTEQTGELFVKNLIEIEVSTEAPDKWDKPEAEPDSGEVAPGTLVKLSSVYNDADKIYYTTDGSNPTMDSPMYNWIASRWWSARADVLDSINHPIEITKDTTIKAKVIGPGRRDSEVVTFTYKVKEDPIESSKVSSSQGGKVEHGEAVIEIPSGALKKANAELGIQKVTNPPAVPSGFKLLSSVYEFIVDGEKSYSFAKSVTIKLSFDPNAVDEGETPSIYYYDENLEHWVNIGGEVSGNTVTVQVEHFTKFAVMVAGKPEIATGLITPGEGGTVSLGGEAVIEIPSGALTGTGAVEVKIEKVTAPPAVPAGFKLVGSVYEFSVDGKSNYSFANDVTIKLSYDSGTINGNETPVVYYYDEELVEWVNLGGEVSGNIISVQVDHFTKFAVMVAVKEPILTDIDDHWAMDNINKLVSMGCINGYPDGTFKPDHPITRAEFATILVKAFQFENKGGIVFADTAGHWARDYIAMASANGVVTGYDDDTFGPDDLITREQMAVMIVRAAKLASEAGETSFTDSDNISHWAKDSIAIATGNGIMKGYPDHTVRPQDNATRAEAVTVIINALEISLLNSQ